MLDFVCVGGGGDTGIDGIGIKVNDRLVRNIDEVSEIAQESRRINVDFCFIQSKMRPKFERDDLNTFGTGVKVFFSEPLLPQNTKVQKFRQIKDFIYSDEEVIRKLDRNPSIILYYVSTGRLGQVDTNFSGYQSLLIKELEEVERFERVEVNLVGGDQLRNFCRELRNQFDVQMNIIDIFPMLVDSQTDVKKAYAFTCEALEFLKLLKKEDDSLRRSLFNNNVRDYLGDNKTVNSEIENTITDNPDMFLLCNNGITIVCTEFEQVRDKLVKIGNPQIVNGCQTSNSLFNQYKKDNQNIKNVKLLIRLICTENPEIANKIVRGTNKQNQVLEEAFEATRSFHQHTLEPFFLACDKSDVKLYYERRAKQYNNDPNIKKGSIVNLKTLTQVFVSVFLDSPHDGHRHESTLFKNYIGQKEERKIFAEEHNPYSYYICALIWYRFDQCFKTEKIDKRYSSFKAHLYLIFRMSVGEFPPKLTNTKKIEGYCEKLLGILQETLFEQRLDSVLKVFDTTRTLWIKKGKSSDGIKDNKEFTELLLKEARECFIQGLIQEEEDDIIYEGIVFNIIHRNEYWFGFIKHVNQDEDNVYFDSRGYGDNVSNLSPGTHVRFKRKINTKGYYADNIQM